MKRLRKLEINRIDAVDAGANYDKATGEGSHILLIKRDEELQAAEWTAAFINDLPDSSFAVIEPGGEKDEEGKTKPRSLRHLPYKDANGKIDLPHLRNALARLPQTKLSGDLKSRARKKLEAAARAAGVGEHKEKRDMFGWVRELVSKMMHPMTTSEIVRHDEAMAQWYRLRDAFLRSIESIMHPDTEMDEDEKADMMMRSVEEFANSAKSVLGQMSSEDVNKLSETLETLDKATSGGDPAEISSAAALLSTNNTEVNDVDSKQLEEITKRMEAQEAEIKKLRDERDNLVKRTEAAEGIAKAERDRRELNEAIAKAEEKWPHLIGDKTVKGQVYLKIEKREALNEDEAKAITAMLDSAESLAKSSFAEIGSSGEGQVGDAWEEIEKRASALIKDNPKMSRAEAISSVLSSDQELYRRYRDEESRAV